MDLLARRDVKRLSQLCGDSDAQVRAAIGLITRLEPKPGRRFVDVERNIVVPDVLVTQGRPRRAGRAFACSSIPTSCRGCACTTSMPAR